MLNLILGLDFLLIPIVLIIGLLGIIALIFTPDKPDWLKKLSKRLHGDSSVDAPPPDIKKKEKGK